MHCTVKMTEDLYWVGASDRRLALFESVYPIPRGVSYNAYVLLDEKTVLLDTVDQSVAGQFFENLAHVLGGRPLDYIVVHHMEPDHAKTLEETVRRYPEAKIICNAKIRDMIRNYFTFDIDARAILMAEGDTYCFGKHTFAYVMAPMVHWPEVMVSFDVTTGTLFSADAFGTFGALSGNLRARLAARCPPLLYEHCRQVRHAGAGSAQESRHARYPHDLPAARPRLAQEHRLVRG